MCIYFKLCLSQDINMILAGSSLDWKTIFALLIKHLLSSKMCFSLVFVGSLQLRNVPVSQTVIVSYFRSEISFHHIYRASERVYFVSRYVNEDGITFKSFKANGRGLLIRGLASAGLEERKRVKNQTPFLWS